MGKTKSAILLSLISVIVAVLIVVCFVSFPCGDIYYYNSILSQTEKDADFGGNLVDGETYVGGGYTVVYYPEGVISAREYDETVSAKTGDELTEYTEKYVAYGNGAIYLEKEVACKDGTTDVSENFLADVKNVVKTMEERYESLHFVGTKVQLCDDFTVRVTLPATVEAAAVAFRFLAYTGEFTMSFGESEDSTSVIIPAQKGERHDVSYYIKGASVESFNGEYAVAIEFTKEGRAIIAETTAGGTGTIYFQVGENQVLGLTVSSKIDQKTLYISGSYTGETAAIVASLIDNAVKGGTEDDIALTLGEITRNYAGFGENALNLVYIALGVCILAMLIVFFVRFKGLGFANLLSFAIFTIAMTLCVWSVGALYIGAGTIVAYAISAILLVLSNAVAFESAKKEYATGKTIATSVKTGYKKCVWTIFDIHIVVVAIGLLAYLIGLAELSAFGLVITFGAAISALTTLFINRFLWHVTLPFAKDKGRFCNFKRNLEVEDDD